MNNNIIQAIIDMDKAAVSRRTTAEEEASRIAAESERKRLDLTRNAKAKTEAEASRICEEIKAKADKEIEQIMAETDEKCRRLDEAMDNGAEERIKGVVERIFGGIKENG